MKTQTDTALQELKSRIKTVTDLNSANGLLVWDQQTYMPKGGVEERSEQMATLARLAHEIFTRDDTHDLLERASKIAGDTETDDGALVRVVRRDYERATKLPAELVAEISRATSLAEPAWVEARFKSEWNIFAPHLTRILGLQREAAERYGYTAHIYDALLDTFEPGATTAQLKQMFDELKKVIVPLTRRIAEQQRRERTDRTAPLHGDFDEAKQQQFGVEVIQKFGYDFNRGRQDRTVHPFCISFGIGDVRITTRFNPKWLQPALFGTMHEAGHGVYQQGMKESFSRTPLMEGASMGVHESQSRLWENLVGRSRPFWTHFYPRLQQVFPSQLASVKLEDFYRAINVVAPTPIRVEADEVTYNLHTLLRFEIEMQLLEGSLTVKDLPAAWNAKMEEYLGLKIETDAQGALQDIHWSNGSFGYFPTYTIGNVLSVQLFDAAVAAHPTIISEMEQGEFATLHEWLRENIYQHGSKFLPNDLIKRATGNEMDAAPYLNYLQTKFGELYELS